MTVVFYQDSNLSPPRQQRADALRVALQSWVYSIAYYSCEQGREYARRTKITATAGRYQGTNNVSCLLGQVTIVIYLSVFIDSFPRIVK